MKKLLIIALPMLMAAAAIAQNPAKQSPRKAHARQHGMQRGAGMGKMAEKLNLTEAQKQQMQTLQQQHRQQMKELQSQDNITVKEQREKRAALMQQQHQQMQAILTPEQRQQLEQMKQNGKDKGRQMHQKRQQVLNQKLNLTEAQQKALAAQR
ncbi:MAG TPA: Spy/CpxP family protein refolding chaperone, partial [Phnomibacter sp.]|nr:Spy/CpxP family protein refolding chaperone [Phnomibacter sp.]